MTIKEIGANIFKGDKSIWMIFFLLCMVSITEMYSASSSLISDGNHISPLMSHVKTLVLGSVILLIVQYIPFKYYKVLWGFFFLLSMILLSLTLFGGAINGAKRFFDFGGKTFQPSELAKTAMVMALAVKLSNSQVECKKRKGKNIISYPQAIKGGSMNVFWWCVAYILIISGLILPENFSTAALTWTIGTIMMFLGNIEKKCVWRWIATFAILGGVSFTIMLSISKTTLRHIHPRAVVWRNRLVSHFEKQDTISKTITLEEAQEQENAAAVTIANSKITGRGIGNSMGRNFLQHAESDMVYAIVIEEMGVVGALGVMGLYLWLLVRVKKIANKCDLFFPAFLVSGLGIMMVLQALINMGVTVGLLPVTGQTLPLLSKGGSSVVVVCLNFGIILNVSRYVEDLNKKAKSVVLPVEGDDVELKQ